MSFNLNRELIKKSFKTDLFSEKYSFLQINGFIGTQNLYNKIYLTRANLGST